MSCSAVTGEGKRHIAEKPTAVMEWVLGVVPKGALILDPFMGSGTTLEVAKRLGHRAVGIECNEDYCQVAVNRLKQGYLFS